MMMSTLVFAACGDSEEPPKPDPIIVDDEPISGAFPSKYFIQQYRDVSSFRVWPCPGYAMLAACGEEYGAEKIDNPLDNHYNRELVPFMNTAVFNTFRAMELTSDSDFDDLHKAGAPLNDLVNFAGASPYEFISRGYRSSDAWKDAGLGFYFEDKVFYYNYGYEPVYGPLSTLDANGLRWIDPLFYLEFASQPTLSKIHNLTLTVTDNTGKTLTATWQQTFRE